MSDVYVQRNGEKVKLTSEELEEFSQRRADAAASVAEIAAAKEAQASARASAIAKLQELGLTVEEVKVAFGLEADSGD